MYIAHFGLERPPFEPLTTSPRLYPSRSLCEAVEHFRYARENREGFLLLVGRVGVGKSIAIQAILQSLPPETPVAVVRHTTMKTRELMEEIARRFGIDPGTGASKSRLLAKLEELFAEHWRKGDKPLLILDESQLLTRAALEEVRLLSNLERDGDPILQICLVGQPELVGRLRDPRLPQLRQRVSVRCRLEPLSLEETRQYLAHRLREAGSARAEEVFTPEAAAAVHRLTGGLPREINVVAGQAMLNAYLEDKRTVSRNHVTSVKGDYGFEGAHDRLATAEPIRRETDETRHEEDPTRDTAGELALAAEPARMEAKEPRATGREEAALTEISPPEPYEPFEEPRTRSRGLLFAVLLFAVVGVGLAFFELWPAFDPALPPPPVPEEPGMDASELAAPEASPPLSQLRRDLAPAIEQAEPSAEDPAAATPEATAPPTDDASEPSPEASAPSLPVSSREETRSEPSPQPSGREAVRSSSEEPPALARPARGPAPSPPVEARNSRRVETPVEVTSALARSADFLERGSSLAESGRLDEAIASFRQAVEHRPDWASAHYNLGLALLERGDTEQAIAELRRAISLDPNDALALGSLGRVLHRTGESEEALEFLDRALAIDPNNRLAREYRGLALAKLGRLEEASEAYRQLSSATPGDAHALQNLGITLHQLKRHEEALAAFRKAIEAAPEEALTYHHMGMTLLEIGRAEEAIGALRRAAELSPNDPLIHHNLGFALKESGRIDEAIAAFRQAIALDPDFALAYYNQGLAFRKAGREEEAKQALRHATRLGLELP